jgi:radical SAM superfamily enzyme YgiQ (UPF0313 family)
MKELNFLVSEGYKQIMFVDDNFTLNPKRVKKICKIIKKEKFDFEWLCEGRVDQSSYDMFRMMSKAGCRMMYFGIENANPKVLQYYNKMITPMQSEKAVTKARKAGIDIIVGSFIVGAPNETKKDIQRTFNFTRKLDIDIPQINVLGAFPGNLIWEDSVNAGILNEDEYWETGVAMSKICSKAISVSKLREMINNYYRKFLVRPQYLVKQLFLTLKSRYRLNLAFNNVNRISTIREGFKSFKAE